MNAPKPAAYDRGFAAGRRDLAEELHAMLFPEHYPPGTDRHDPLHTFWDGRDAADVRPGETFQWSADTIEWVAELLDLELTGI